MLEALRGFGEYPRHRGEVQLPRQSTLAHRGVAGRFSALGENRLLDEVEPVGEFDLLRNGSAADPRPHFAEHRTVGGQEGLEVECAVEAG